jgi:hypothetical protein
LNVGASRSRRLLLQHGLAQRIYQLPAFYSLAIAAQLQQASLSLGLLCPLLPSLFVRLRPKKKMAYRQNKLQRNRLITIRLQFVNLPRAPTKLLQNMHLRNLSLNALTTTSAHPFVMANGCLAR